VEEGLCFEMEGSSFVCTEERRLALPGAATVRFRVSPFFPFRISQFRNICSSLSPYQLNLESPFSIRMLGYTH